MTLSALALGVGDLQAQQAGGCPVAIGPGWQRSAQVAAIPADRSQLQVEQALLARARQEVVERVSGIQVAASTVRSRSETMAGGRSERYSDVYLEMFSQTTAGRIVEERRPCVSRVGVDSLRLVLDARVEVEREDAAAGFEGDVQTDQPAYRNGDAIEVSVRSNQAARVYLFAVQPDGSATLFFPNQYDTLNLLRPNEVRHIPSRGGAAYNLVAELNPRLGPTHLEVVRAVFYRGTGGAPFATRDAFTRTFTLAEVNRVLMALPRRDRVEASDGYEIRGMEGR